MTSQSSCGWFNFNRARPFIGVVFMQVGFAGMDVLCKAALNKGMSNYVLVVYRHAVATIVMAPFAAILDKSTFSPFLLFTEQQINHLLLLFSVLRKKKAKK